MRHKPRRAKTLELLEPRRLLAIDAFLDFGDFDLRLADLTDRVTGFGAITASERSDIIANIKTGVESVYSDFDITFSLSEPTGDHDTIDFGFDPTGCDDTNLACPYGIVYQGDGFPGLEKVSGPNGTGFTLKLRVDNDLRIRGEVCA